VTILLDIILAFTQSVPELDGLIAGTGDNLPVISTEADGENIGGVADEAAGGCASVQIPETESVIPGRRQSKLTIRRDDDIGNEVVMAVEDALGVSVGVLIASQLPDDNGLVCTKQIRYKIQV